MKRIIIPTILVLIIYFQGFGQGKVDCPRIRVIPPSGLTKEGDSMSFSVSLIGKFENKGLQFKWTASNGTISYGQGTAAIVISTNKEMSGQTVTVTVEIKGLPEGCQNSFSESGEVDVSAPIIDRRPDRYGKINWKDEQIRLHNVLLLELGIDPKMKAYFIFYYQKNSELKLIKSRQKNIAKFLQANNIPPNRFQFVMGGKGDVYETQIWLVPEGSLPPQ
jgi:hypothetical protein